ncbi:PAS domain-containing protein [Salipiger sp. PrR003]|uniref:PAS domain-containing protein n=1 Tax=Salipiger sp. PrR003 TaxID=2706776 RepID=UPI0013DA8B61|nr:PAS domain-containing protein [Salipiger sp. PrR003]NDV52566.1 PAS domain-containing protein [Salipiger sp. PrR003]
MKRETEKTYPGQVSAGATKQVAGDDPRSLAAHIVETIPLPLMVLDSALGVLACNPAFTTAYNLQQQDVLGKRLPDVGEGQWDSPDFLERLHEVLPEGQPLRPWEAEREFPGRGIRVLRMQGRRLDHLQMILLIVEDITQRHRKQREQAMLIQELAHRMKNVFAAIEGLAEKSLLRSDAADPHLSFLSQLRAYLRVQHRLLTDRGACDIRDLVQEALEPHLFDTDRLALHGDPIALDQDTCTVLALVLHELQANAWHILNSVATIPLSCWKVRRTDDGAYRVRPS